MTSLFSDDPAVGTVVDMSARLRSTLPTGWFPASPPPPAPSATPVLDGLLAGLGQAWSFCYALLVVVDAQTRLAKAYGGFLDMMSVDFFASSLPRRSGETDDAFRARISASLISRRGTRQDVIRAVSALTLSPPALCEPTHAADCGGYGGAGNADAGGGVGYGSPGLCYGSASLPFQYLLNVGSLAAFAPGLISARQGPATFIDGNGLIQPAAPRVLRPDYQNGVCIGALLEPRGFNLVTDSRFWSGFAASGGTAATWLVDASTPGLFGSDPVMTVSTTAGSRVPGPSIDVAVAGSAVCGSAWILIVNGSNLTDVELALTDLNDPDGAVHAAADMTRPGQWQRVSASLLTQAAPGRNLRIGLLLSGPGDADAGLVTQCWQAEPGDGPSSYIPTSGMLGLRAQDDVVATDPTVTPVAFSVSDVMELVASTIPAATIAWTSVNP